MQEGVDEIELVRGRQAIVDELAGFAPIGRTGSASLKPLTAIIDSAAKVLSSLELERPLPTSAIDEACR